MVVVVHPRALGMELLGVHDILQITNQLATEAGSPAPYAVVLASVAGGPISLWAGLELGPTCATGSIRGRIDTLIVVGGPVALEAAEDRELVRAVRRLARRAGRVVGICTGTAILAAAGLLAGRRATTHWAFGELIAARHPDVEVDTDPIFVADGRVSTSAGVTSGFDLTLALVEADAGAALARQVARLLVLHLRRTGHQSQFSVHLEVTPPAQLRLRELQRHIVEHPETDLSLAALASRLHLSPRHFARVFSAEVGMSPGRYVERVRLDAARRLLESTDAPTEVVATTSGFGNYQALRRAFTAAFAVTPAEYRRRFGAAATGLSLVV